MIAGHFLLESGWQSSRCSHAHEVQSLEPIAHSAELSYFQPAPIDLHVHGAGGHDVMAGEGSLRRVLATQAQLGCGALLATSVAAPIEAIDDFIDSVRKVMASPDPGSAILLGAHLEGPFINPNKLGAQPPHASAVNSNALERWLSSGVVRVVTFAPEMDAENIVPAMCEQYGAKAQIGHSLCDCWQASAALQAGCGVTHLWNAMSGASHRDGGVAVAALATAHSAEIIIDGIHVDEMAFRAAYRAIPNLYAVTDGTAAVGMPDGVYRLGSHDVQRIGNTVQLDDGTLAGSCLDQRRLCEVLRAWGLGWEEIAQLHSARPAAWIGEASLGRIAPGCGAHWLERIDEKLLALWLNGERLEIRH